MSRSALFLRTPRDFTALKVGAALAVGAEADALAEGSGGGPLSGQAARRQASVQAQSAGGKANAAGAVAHPRARPLPAMNLDAVPHPSDDFLKSDGG